MVNQPNKQIRRIVLSMEEKDYQLILNSGYMYSDSEHTTDHLCIICHRWCGPQRHFTIQGIYQEEQQIIDCEHIGDNLSICNCEIDVDTLHCCTPCRKRYQYFFEANAKLEIVIATYDVIGDLERNIRIFEIDMICLAND
jgi:hypothetical protein